MLSNGEGFLMGIINGFGSMANRYIEDDAAIEKQRKLEEIKAQIEEQKMRTQQALELEFAPQKAQVASDIEETARNKRVGIVNDALEKRAETAVQNKYADPVMGDEPLTEDQQSVLNDGMAKNVRDREQTRQGILNSSMERLKATQDAGLKPDPTVVNAEQKEENLAQREANITRLATQAQDKLTSAEKIAQGKLDLGRDALAAKNNAALLDSQDRVLTHQQVSAFDTDIKTAQAQIKDYTKQLGDMTPSTEKKPNPAYDEIVQARKDAYQEIKDKQKQRDLLLTQLADDQKARRASNQAATPSAPAARAARPGRPRSNTGTDFSSLWN